MREKLVVCPRFNISICGVVEDLCVGCFYFKEDRCKYRELYNPVIPRSMKELVD